MSNYLTIARPYAKAIFELGLLHNDLQNCLCFLQGLAVVVNDSQIMNLSKNKALSQTELVNLIMDIVESVTTINKNTSSVIFYEMMKNLVSLLISCYRLNIVCFVATLLHDLINQHNNTDYLEIHTAFVLSKKQIVDLCSMIHQKTGRFCMPKIVLDKSLISGVKIYLNNKVFDFSVKSRLLQLNVHLMQLS